MISIYHDVFFDAASTAGSFPPQADFIDPGVMLDQLTHLRLLSFASLSWRTRLWVAPPFALKAKNNIDERLLLKTHFLDRQLVC